MGNAPVGIPEGFEIEAAAPPIPEGFVVEEPSKPVVIPGTEKTGLPGVPLLRPRVTGVSGGYAPLGYPKVKGESYALAQGFKDVFGEGVTSRFLESVAQALPSAATGVGEAVYAANQSEEGYGDRLVGQIISSIGKQAEALMVGGMDTGVPELKSVDQLKDPEFVKTYFPRVAGSAMGSMIGFMGMGKGVGAASERAAMWLKVGEKATKAAAVGGTVVGMSGVEALSQAGFDFETALAAGANPDTAAEVAARSAAMSVGPTTLLNAGDYFIPGGKGVRAALGDVLGEVAQETWQEFSSNWAHRLYDENRPLTQGFSEAAIGAGFGAAVGRRMGQSTREQAAELVADPVEPGQLSAVSRLKARLKERLVNTPTEAGEAVVPEGFEVEESIASRAASARDAGLGPALDAIAEGNFEDKFDDLGENEQDAVLRALDEATTKAPEEVLEMSKSTSKPKPKPKAVQAAAIPKEQRGQIEAEAEKVLAPEQLGGKVEVKTAKGTKAEAQYALVDATELVTSHDTGLNENPNYPQALQPRDRTRKASQSQVAEIVSKLDPEQLGGSYLADDGAPIVGQDLLVESGNARTIALRTIYEQGLKQGDSYKQWLKQKSGEFGLSPEQVDKVSNPVLVRIRRSKLDRIAFAQEANADSKARMSATEQAKVDAGRLSGGLMEGFVPSESGAIVTAGNRQWVRDFFAHVIPAGEHGEYQTKDGSISQAGITRIRNAVFAKAYGDSSALEKLAEDPDDNIKNVVSGMLKAAPKFAALDEAIKDGSRHDLNLSGEIGAAAAKLSSLREQGKTVGDYLTQDSFFGDELGEDTRNLLQVFDQYKRSGKKVARVLADYAAAVDALGDPKQAGLFGQKVVPTKKEILQAVLNDIAREDANEAEVRTKNKTDGGKDGRVEAKPAEEKPAAESAGQPAEEVAPPNAIQRKVAGKDSVVSSVAEPPAITEEAIARAFPGATIRPGSAAHRAEGEVFYVDLPGGGTIRVETDATLHVNPETVRRDYGREPHPGDQVAGRWSRIDRGGLIALAKIGTEGTLSHEAFHAAMDLALTPTEKRLVLNRYGNEEAGAEAYRKWRGQTAPNTWFGKIRRYFRNLYAKLTGQPEAVFGKLKSGEVWKRPAANVTTGEPRYSIINDALSALEVQTSKRGVARHAGPQQERNFAQAMWNAVANPVITRIRNEGKAGAELARLIEQAADDGEIAAGERLAKLGDVELHKLKEDDRFDVMDALEGRKDDKDLSKGARAAVEVIRSVLDEQATEAIDLKVRVKRKGSFTPQDDLPHGAHLTPFQREERAQGHKIFLTWREPFRRRKNYYPHRIPWKDDLRSGAVRKSVIKNLVRRGVRPDAKGAEQFLDGYLDFLDSGKPGDALIQYLVKTGQAATEGEALLHLQRYRRRLISRQGSLEYARQVDLPFYDPDPASVLPPWIVKTSARLRQVAEFGQDNERVNKLILKIRNSGGDADFVRGSVDQILGMINETDSDVERVSRTLRTLQAFKLGMAAIPNLSQGVLNSLLLVDAGTVVAGVARSFTAAGKRKAVESGASLETVVQESMRQVGRDRGLSGAFLKVVGFSMTERWNRRVAANVGIAFAEKLSKRLRVSPRENRTRAKLEMLGLDPDVLLAQGGAKNRDFLIAAKRLSDITQFRSRPQDLPAWTSTPSGKVIFQFKSYIYQQTRLLNRAVIGELREKRPGEAFRALLLLATVFPLTGEAIASIRALLKGREREEEGLERYFEDIGQTGGLGIVMDAFQAANYGRFAEWLGGPTAGTVTEVSEALASKNRGQRIWKLAFRHIPLIGQLGYARLFPRKKKDKTPDGI